MKENLYRRTSTVAEKSIDLGVAAYIKTTDTLNPIYEEQTQKIKKISEETSKGIKKVKENTDQTLNQVSNQASNGISVISSFWTSFTQTCSGLKSNFEPEIKSGEEEESKEKSGLQQPRVPSDDPADEFLRLNPFKGRVQGFNNSKSNSRQSYGSCSNSANKNDP